MTDSTGANIPAPTPGERPEDQTDWSALGRRLQEIQNKMIHGEGEPARYGDDFYGEALRRLLTGSRSGWISVAEHDWHVEGHRIIDRLNLEAARRKARDARRRYATASRKMRAELADWIREVTNERTVPSRYRRQGVLLAADWIDPASPASPYTDPEVGR